jgi:hypothetical protein
MVWQQILPGKEMQKAYGHKQQVIMCAKNNYGIDLKQ